MCRIAGLFSPKSQAIVADIERMTDSMRRGGPDDSGTFLHPSLPFALGHRRLSLLDLSKAGHQPMASSEEDVQIVFNGEIYNFETIREELKASGFTFKTKTDTEVILYSYKRWGVECFKKFNGMFALAIWDEKNQEVILARDHAGIKPLYYHISPDLFVFASEIRAFKSLKKDWKQEEVWKPLFLMFGHLPEPFSTLKDVRTLNKGEWMKVCLPSLKITRGVWHEETYSVTEKNKENALRNTRSLMEAAVKRHLISDAPIGLFLSGGIDSSLLTLLAAPILKDNLSTLSIQFDEAEFSEAKYQKIIADLTQATHTSFSVTKADFEKHIDDIYLAMDQPTVDSINTYFISKYARELGLKAVLSGVGADEIFGGYPSFHRFNQWRGIKNLPILSTVSKRIDNKFFSKLSFLRYNSPLSLCLLNHGLFSPEKTAKLTGISVEKINDALNEVNLPRGVNYSSQNAVAANEMHFYMKNQLLKDSDCMSMWHGLEIRVPFLDKELVNYVSSVDPKIKFGKQAPKELLVKSFDHLLPDSIVYRKKQGFTFPFAHWLKQSEAFSPSGKDEEALMTDFKNGKVHWSRYWVLKLMNNEKFN